MIVLRTLAILVGALVLALMSLYLTLPNVAPPAQLALLSLFPGGSSASARAAMAELRLVADSRDPQRSASERLAISALRQEPGNIAAIRALAAVHAVRGDEERADRLLRFGERMTRRDARTNLALAELAIKHGDAAATVRYLGHVVATSQLFGDAAADRLIVAARDPAVARELGGALRSGPTWKSRFMSRFVRSTAAPDALAGTLSHIARPGLGNVDMTYLATAFRTLLKAKSRDRAAALYRQIFHGVGPLLRDGGFEESGRDPFGWELVSDAGLSALEAPAEGGRGRRLDMISDAGRAGVVADQILALPPGRYRLSATLAGGEPRAPQWPAVTIACAGEKDVRTRLARMAGNRSAATVVKEFSIPDTCALQTLAVHFGAPFDASRSEGWVDDLAIARAAPAP